MKKPLTLTQMFNRHVGIEPENDTTLDWQDERDYINERTAIRADNGQTEQEAIEGARQDLDRLQGVEVDKGMDFEF